MSLSSSACRLDVSTSSRAAPYRALRYALSGVLVGVLLGFASTEARAQRFGLVEETESNIDSYYYYVQPGAATIEVKVMGTVRNPGLYRLSEGTDFGQLLALSGGPTLEVRQRSRPRTATVRLYRPQAQEQVLLYEAEFERNVVTASENYPALQNGDIMTVEVTERQRFVWRDLFTIVNTVAVIALAVERLVGPR